MKDKPKGTNQLLVYVDDINLLIRNKNATEESNRYNSINKKTSYNNNTLLVISISSICFGR
jgi:hypothetical protein